MIPFYYVLVAVAMVLIVELQLVLGKCNGHYFITVSCPLVGLLFFFKFWVPVFCTFDPPLLTHY